MCTDITSRHTILYSVCNTLFGICAGWTNENTSLALIVIVALIISIHILRRDHVHPWMWTGLAGNAIGCALLFLSPAQAKRLAAAGGFGNLMQWIERLISITKNVICYLWPLILVFMAALYLFLRTIKREREMSRSSVFSQLSAPIVFTLGTGVSIYAMVGSPEFPVWIWSSILAFALISAINMADTVNISSKRAMRYFRGSLIVTLLLAIMVSYASIAPELHRIDNAYHEREQYIASAGYSDISVEPITTTCRFSSYSLFAELSDDPNIWPNTAIANYYGLKSISISPG